jgi:hypothetical protein
MSQLENKVTEKIKNPQIQDFILNDLIQELTPVNGVASQGTLALSGVVIDGETVTIDGDTYEFLADDAQTKTASGNIAVDITSFAGKAQGTLTVTDQVSAEESFVIGATTYTFKASATEAGHVEVGANEAETKANMVAAINGTDELNEANASASAAAFDGDDMVVTALIGGTAGNSIVFTEDITNATIDGGGTLGTTTAGDDCTAAEADGALIGADAGTTYGLAQGTAESVVATAATKGVAGDLIEVSETMANGTWGSEITTLGDTTAGVDGTLGTANQLCQDGSYLYVCTAKNTISDANWRRISLGSAY